MQDTGAWNPGLDTIALNSCFKISPWWMVRKQMTFLTEQLYFFLTGWLKASEGKMLFSYTSSCCPLLETRNSLFHYEHFNLSPFDSDTIKENKTLGSAVFDWRILYNLHNNSFVLKFYYIKITKLMRKHVNETFFYQVSLSLLLFIKVRIFNIYIIYQVVF